MGRTARNMSELNSMLLAEVNNVMQEFSKQALSDMKEQTSEFYDYAQPEVYERTEVLKNSPKISNVTITTTPIGGVVSFDAYLDQNHRYTTGKNPTMHQVLEVAETHKKCSYYKLRAPVGHQGFWKRSQKSMARDFKKTMRKYFRLKTNRKK